MKAFIISSIAIMSLVSCKKNIEPFPSELVDISYVRHLLKDSLSQKDWVNLDFKHVRIAKGRDDASKFITVPFMNRKADFNFVLLEIDQQHVVKRSGIITLFRSHISDQSSSDEFDGSIIISSLTGKVLIRSQIDNGHIIAFHEKFLEARGATTLVVPGPKETPPEIISTYEPFGIYNIWWLSYQGLFGQNNTTAPVSYFQLASPEPSGGGGGGGGQVEEPIIVDFEPPVESLAAIDLEKYLHCFDAIPDAGATCSIEILADIPVDADPNKLLDYRTGSPGHTFLQIKKTNGSKTVMQNIGFYPEKGWKTLLTTAPIKGKFVDNGSHEFNAALIQKISPELLKQALMHMRYLAKFIKYDIDEYNCTDFALDVFNSVRFGDILEVPKYGIPGGGALSGTSTAQGLYNKISDMQKAGVESSNINIPGVKGWVSDSHGPCN